jgi:type IV pilus assembly protein PilA
MKTFVKALKRQEGFTLVELMVVVAIIGLLSAVAVPNFKKYQAKAKTSEAKLQLSAAYTAEQSFFSDYNIYHICLRYMGFDPSGEAAQRYFNVGFGSGAPAVDATAQASAASSGLNTGAYAAGTSVTVNGQAVIENAGGGCENAVGADGNTFFQAAKKIGTTVAPITELGAKDAALNQATSIVTTSVVPGIGIQSVDSTMVFRVSAAGYIDQDNVAAGRSSYFWINQDKQIGNPRTGY